MEEKREYYLTPSALEKIAQELETLKKIKQTKVKKGTPQTFHSEDLNPEYLSFIEDLESLEKRIHELEEILKRAKNIAEAPREEGKVGIGCKVLVEIEGKEDEFLIVESIEADPSQGKISYLSPVGKALLGKKEGDVVEISFPLKLVYKIKKVTFEF